MYDPTVPGMKKLRKSFDLPGHAHELTFSCRKHLPLLSRDRSRRWFLEALDEARRRFDLELWAYVIMPEHVHVLLFPRSDGYAISAVLKAVKQPVARKALNYLRENAPEWLPQLEVKRGGRVEHRFWEEGGGYDRNIYTPKAAWASVSYLHENPVRRGLVTNALDWPWSSARCYAGIEPVELKVDGCPPDV